MALATIRPTGLDRALAALIAHKTRPGIEKVAKIATLSADEHVMLGILAAVWLGSRFFGAPRRRAANDLVVTGVISAVLPHLLKRVIDQQRPDRRVSGPRHGIPRSGKAYDAFPSGHAVHIGAIAAALSRLYPRRRGLIWTAGAGIAATRVLLLAHWLTDVLAGLALGAMIERTTRRVSVTASRRSGDTRRDKRTRRPS
jgi:membrane-associated phospholipid phosphatase